MKTNELKGYIYKEAPVGKYQDCVGIAGRMAFQGTEDELNALLAKKCAELEAAFATRKGFNVWVEGYDIFFSTERKELSAFVRKAA